LRIIPFGGMIKSNYDACKCSRRLKPDKKLENCIKTRRKKEIKVLTHKKRAIKNIFQINII